MALYSINITVGAGINPNSIPNIYKKWNLNLGTCFKLSRLAASAGGIAFFCGRGFNHLKFYMNRQINPQYFSTMQ